MEKSRTIAALVVAIMAVGTLSAVTLAQGSPEPPTPDPVPTPSPSPTRYVFPNVQSNPPKQPLTAPDTPCTPVHFGFEGNPRKYRMQVLAHYEVPPGRTWRLTNSSIMMERHHGGAYAVAGEWTGLIQGIHDGSWKGRNQHDGRLFTVAQSSLDHFQGVALQGQTLVDVLLDEGDVLSFAVWLRPYTNDRTGTEVTADPRNYYFDIGLSGTDCPA